MMVSHPAFNLLHQALQKPNARVEEIKGKLHLIDRTTNMTRKRLLTAREAQMHRVFKKVPKF